MILNAGLDADLADNIALYGNVDFEHRFDDLSEAIGGEIGVGSMVNGRGCSRATHPDERLANCIHPPAGPPMGVFAVG
jgi:hypothetical protein